MKEVLSFLKELSENNHRAWFEEHKATYLRVKNKTEELAASLINALGKVDPDIAPLTVKDCTYRIYKDVRFSKDKTPYKTHIGIYFVRGGKKSKYAGYYLHMEPDNCFLSGGVYMPMPEDLKKIRQEIYYHTEDFKKILNQKRFKEIYGELTIDNKLKMPPKDFPKDFPDIDLLKYKDYFVIHPVSADMLDAPDFVNYAVKTWDVLKPFNRFCNRALDF